MNQNYFNYFTEIEEHFQRARGTGLFLLSPLDWALIETWRGAGIPLEAVLRGIDVAFEKWRARPARSRIHQVNSLAYCTQAISAEAQAIAEGKPARRETPAPFAEPDLSGYLQNNAAALQSAGLEDLANAVIALDREEMRADLETLEQHLTALEEKLIARLRASASDDQLLEARQVLDRQLKPYRGKMSTEQLSMLERQFLDRRLLETARLPRLSLFYLTAL